MSSEPLAYPPLSSADVRLKSYLDALATRLETEAFIESDPIAIPHAYSDPADREIIGLFAALLAWGRRSTIMNKLAELSERMDFRPAHFVRSFGQDKEQRLYGFKHRTFSSDDAVWLTRNLSEVLRRFGTLEEAFRSFMPAGADDPGGGIEGLSSLLASATPGTPVRLSRHLARPSTGSACKRLNMYLRWMVRPGPVDFHQWTCIHPRQLVLPLDVHSGRSSRLLGLLSRPANDWKAALELTARLRSFCPDDPVRYDFALFGAPASGIPLEPPTNDSGDATE